MATQEHQNAGRLRVAFEAFARGDIAPLRVLFAPSFVWHVSSPKRFAGDRQGWAEFQEYLGLLARETAGTMRIQTIQIFADEAYGVALLRISRERAGRSLSNFAVQVVRFKDGLIVEGWFLDEIPYELDEFYR